MNIFPMTSVLCADFATNAPVCCVWCCRFNTPSFDLYTHFQIFNVNCLISHLVSQSKDLLPQCPFTPMTWTLIPSYHHFPRMEHFGTYFRHQPLSSTRPYLEFLSHLESLLCANIHTIVDIERNLAQAFKPTLMVCGENLNRFWRSVSGCFLTMVQPKHFSTQCLKQTFKLRGSGGDTVN